MAFWGQSDSILLDDQVWHRAGLALSTVLVPKGLEAVKHPEIVLDMDIILMTRILAKEISDRNQRNQGKTEKRGYALWSLPMTHWFINTSWGFLELAGGPLGEELRYSYYSCSFYLDRMHLAVIWLSPKQIMLKKKIANLKRNICIHINSIAITPVIYVVGQLPAEGTIYLNKHFCGVAFTSQQEFWFCSQSRLWLIFVKLRNHLASQHLGNSLLWMRIMGQPSLASLNFCEV